MSFVEKQRDEEKTERALGEVDSQRERERQTREKKRNRLVIQVICGYVPVFALVTLQQRHTGEINEPPIVLL